MKKIQKKWESCKLQQQIEFKLNIIFFYCVSFRAAEREKMGEEQQKHQSALMRALQTQSEWLFCFARSLRPIDSKISKDSHLFDVFMASRVFIICSLNIIVLSFASTSKCISMIEAAAASPSRVSQLSTQRRLSVNWRKYNVIKKRYYKFFSSVFALFKYTTHSLCLCSENTSYLSLTAQHWREMSYISQSSQTSPGQSRWKKKRRTKSGIIVKFIFSSFARVYYFAINLLIFLVCSHEHSHSTIYLLFHMATNGSNSTATPRTFFTRDDTKTHYSTKNGVSISPIWTFFDGSLMAKPSKEKG